MNFKITKIKTLVSLIVGIILGYFVSNLTTICTGTVCHFSYYIQGYIIYSIIFIVIIYVIYSLIEKK